MSEDALRKLFAERLRPHGAVVRVENPIDPGFPDFVCCFRGRVNMVEAKYIARKPARPSTPVTHEHLTLDQVLWAERWAAAGGSAWLLLQVGRDGYFLCAPALMRAIFEGEVDHAALCERAAWRDSRLTALILKVLR